MTPKQKETSTAMLIFLDVLCTLVGIPVLHAFGFPWRQACPLAFVLMIVAIVLTVAHVKLWPGDE